MNIFDIAIYINTSLGKCLPFESIIRVKIGAIVLIVLPTVALIRDQVDESIILLLNHVVSKDILFSHNIKKDKHFYMNF